MGLIARLLYVITVIVVVGYATVQAHNRLGLTWLLAYLVAINAVAFAFYAYDRVFVRLLKLIRLRVPEKVLIWELAFPGGIFGAFLAMQLFGHKVGPDSHDFRFELLKAFAIQVTLLAALLIILVVQAHR